MHDLIRSSPPRLLHDRGLVASEKLIPASPLSRLSTLLAGMSVARGVDGLYQIAFYQRCHVVSGGECGNYLDRIDGGAVEQYTRHRFPQHARIGPDKGAYLLNRGLELGARSNLETHLGCVRRRRINAEIAQGLTPHATVWHDHLHFVVGKSTLSRIASTP